MAGPEAVALDTKAAHNGVARIVTD
ncbi:MAG: hypothetical protein QOH52_1893, partial [Pseudonocardiales bacterium]|nr:hypothetical protein [Pseudonocardiales bacterium]